MTLRWLILLGSIFIYTSCATINQKPVPTRITEQGQVISGPTRSSGNYYETVFVDARHPLQVRLWSLPQAQPLWWSDYKFDWNNEEEAFAVARRLAALGIGPETEVFVLGAGLSGEGEEGYLALMLKYLGVRRVTLREAMDFRTAKLSGESVKPLSIPIWKPKLRSEMLLSKSDILANVPADRLVLDVRPSSTYLQASDKDPDLQALNVPWTEFYKAMRDGPKSLEKFLGDLEPVGLVKTRPVVLISEDSTSSCLISYILMSSGYERVLIYLPGYQSLR